jgi:hypothetical protein
VKAGGGRHCRALHVHALRSPTGCLPRTLTRSFLHFALAPQGCNTALDSVSALARASEAVGGDLDKLPQAFTRARLPDARAMQQLELMAVLALPGGRYGNALSRAWARCVLASATALGLLAARLGGALSFGKKKRRPPGGLRGAAAAKGGADAGRSNPLFGAPWVRKMYNPAVPPRAILATMHLQAAFVVALFAAAAAGLAWAAAAAWGAPAAPAEWGAAAAGAAAGAWASAAAAASGAASAAHAATGEWGASAASAASSAWTATTEAAAAAVAAAAAARSSLGAWIESHAPGAAPAQGGPADGAPGGATGGAAA